MAKNNILAEIKKVYDQLDDSFDALYAECQTDEQKRRLRSLFASARDTYFAAAAKALTDKNATVDALTKELHGVNDQVQGQLADLKNVVEVLNLCTEAVKLAASLATLAAA
ncbi:MAG TPA: hypothetical protein VKV96_16975 [Roseiarcus sp.]|nr:hypothetical protein [Roseiarcus sp.]